MDIWRLFSSHTAHKLSKLRQDYQSAVFQHQFEVLIGAFRVVKGSLTINDKSVDGVLGTLTWGGCLVGMDKSTEL